MKSCGGVVKTGGEAEWFSVALLVRGENLNPDTVTSLLGVEPDEFLRAGELRGGKYLNLTGLWGLTTENSEENSFQDSLGNAVRSLLARVPASVLAGPDSVWSQACNGHSVTLSVGVSMHTFNRCAVFDADIISVLAAMNCSVELDIYADVLPFESPHSEVRKTGHLKLVENT